MTRTSGGGREGAEDAVDTVDVKEGGWGPREERSGASSAPRGMKKKKQRAMVDHLFFNYNFLIYHFTVHIHSSYRWKLFYSKNQFI